MIQNVKSIIIDDGIFWNENDVIILPNNDPNKKDIVYYSDKEIPKDPINAIAFSTYDGFGLKDIFWLFLKIPVTLISSENRFPELVQKRIKSLQFQDYVPNIADKCSWINEFGKQHKINETIYFGNDQNIVSKFSFAFVVTTTLQKTNQSNIFSFRPPSVIRQFVNYLAEQNSEIQDHLSNKYGLLLNNTQILNNEANHPYVLVLDIDGTITDPRMIVSEDGVSWKRMSNTDIKAIYNWNQMGNITYFMTGDQSSIPFIIAKNTDTPIENIMLKTGDKKAQMLAEICIREKYSPKKVIYAGDDIIDCAVMKWLHSQGGQIFCPANSMPQIKAIPGVQKLKSFGGYGAIKELIDSIIAITHIE